MPVSRTLPAILLSGLAGAFAGPALTADPPPHACLTRAEQRLAVATHKAVPLAEVLKSRHAQGRHGELVRARLCRRGDDLVYVLTLLERSGRVVRATVDAENGELIDGR